MNLVQKSSSLFRIELCVNTYKYLCDVVSAAKFLCEIWQTTHQTPFFLHQSLISEVVISRRFYFYCI